MDLRWKQQQMLIMFLWMTGICVVQDPSQAVVKFHNLTNIYLDILEI